MLPVNTNSNTDFFGGNAGSTTGVFSSGNFSVDEPYINIDSPVKLLIFGLLVIVALFLWLTR